MKYAYRFGMGTAEATYFRFGFCPFKVKITAQSEEDVAIWMLPMAAAASIDTVDSTGVRVLGAAGVRLCKFSDPTGGGLPGSGGTPTIVEQGKWYDGVDGIEINASQVAIADGVPYIVEAWGLDEPLLIRAVHDGTTSSNTYFEDSSIDFRKAGVSDAQMWVVINITNDNWCYIKNITKPSGKANWCRCYTALDDSGTPTAAADFDTADVLILMPRAFMQFPQTGLGLMT